MKSSKRNQKEREKWGRYIKEKLRNSDEGKEEGKKRRKRERHHLGKQ